MYFPQKISCIHQPNAHPDKGIMQNSYLRKEALIGLLAVCVSAIVNKKKVDLPSRVRLLKMRG